MRPPPRWVRRVVLAPAEVALAAVLLCSLPLWLIAALALSPFAPGRLRPLRAGWVAFVYLMLSAFGLVTMLLLWIAAGFGRWVRRPPFQRAHYRLAGWVLRVLFWQARWALRLNIVIRGPDPDQVAPGQPLLVLCRHAGPGDSFILTHALINWFDREPRIVLKDTLQWDPMVDVLLHRLPSRFIAPGTEHAEAAVGALAVDLDPDDAFVIFPEGGNFTPARWQRAIDRLHALGLERMAARAEAMPNVLAPRPGGALAALAAAPEARVVLVAHTGLEHLVTIGDIWRELPMDKTITMQWWAEPAADLPSSREARIDWLYDRWRRIDEWIAAQRR
ncbi:MAG TPA: 1-acyl-sn-glycerol-3-phosphate acyltransferase [Micromonosporaceae bacterium]